MMGHAKPAPTFVLFAAEARACVRLARRNDCAWGVDIDRPGLYEWRIEGTGSYIGQYRWISRPRREYGLNVARLINGLPYRKGNLDGFRRIHRELAAALMEGRRIELVILENGERPALNDRERELIRERGNLNGPGEKGLC